jgi:hypothetical protein
MLSRQRPQPQSLTGPGGRRGVRAPARLRPRLAAMAVTPLLLGLVMPPPFSTAPGTAARASGRPAAAQVGWTPTGTLQVARDHHSATLLPNGKVLVAGGFAGTQFPDPDSTATAELYDPATGTWAATGSMSSPRAAHSAILLPNGKVLVVGGFHQNVPVLTAELYDPATGTWSLTGAMATPRASFAATALGNGEVLALGGYNPQSGTDLASVERYHPATGTWTPAASMGTPRYGHVVTLLADGRVLVAGGVNNANQGGLTSAERYDPATNSWTPTGSMSQARENDEICCHQQVLLPTGDVLAIGGYNGGVLDSTERYRPATGSWSSAAPMQAAREGLHTATNLADGTVLVVGGLDDSGPVASAEVYYPTVNAWSTTAAPGAARAGHSATALPSGAVLVAGGIGANGDRLDSAELYEPPAAGALTPLAPARVLDTRNGNGAPVGKLGPNSSLSLQVTGRGGVPAGGVGAVFLNLTVTQPTAPSHLTVYADGSARPATSNLNFRPDQTIANLTVARIGAGGRVRIYNLAGQTHVIADVAGWFGT